MVSDPGSESIDDDRPGPSVADLLAAAVDALGGTERPGQVLMAEAVAAAMSDGRHLLVQAGTGTGKSLAYLVPALLHDERGRRGDRDDRPAATRSSTATCRPLVDAVEPLLGRRPTYAILKGRANYLCRNKVLAGMPDDDERGAVRPVADHAAGPGRGAAARRGPTRRRPGDRDELDPGVGDRAWRQVSVSARASASARRSARSARSASPSWPASGPREAEIVVTNHAMLAIDALESFAVLPEHDVVVVDEAHELVDRVTGVATDELTSTMVERAATPGPAPGRRHRAT